MFCDACYYISEGWGDRRQNLIVKECNMFFFITEFRERFERPPFIFTLIPITEEEFHAFEDSNKFNEIHIFIGDGEDYNE